MTNNGIQIENTPNILIITDSDQNQITVTQPVTSLVEVTALGPQGQKGDPGDQGDSIFTLVSGSTYATTSSLVVSGSFLVSGSSTFTNIGPAIFSGSVTTNQGFTGSLFGTSSYALTASYAMNGGSGGGGFYIATGSVSASVGLGTGSFIINSGSNDLLFISSSGFVGLGTTSPQYKLDVNGSINASSYRVGSSNWQIKPAPGSYNLGFYNGGTTLAGIISGNNNFILGNTTTDSGFKLDVNGTGRFSGNLTITGSATNSLLVKGSGTTQSTTALLVQNSTGGQLLKVTDDGFTTLGNGNQGIQSNNATFTSYLISNGSIGNVFGTYTSFTPSAMVEINTTTKGFLPPRTNLTSNISNPAQGLITYLTGSTNEGLYYYNSGSYQGWTRILNDSGSQNIAGNLIVTGSLVIQPTSSATQTVAIIQAGSGSIALVPSGSGGIIASVPDGTATGGNARGQYSVDLQILRNNANEIPQSRYSGILSGRNNRIADSTATAGAGDYSFIGGGLSNVINNIGTGGSNVIVGGNGNTIPNNTSYATIGGGQNNSGTSSGYSHWVVAGGSTNNASSNYSTISGGQSNTASTNTHATVVGGQSNTSSGIASVSGGLSNTASGNYAVALGNTNAVSGRNGVGIGQQNTVNQTESYAFGYQNTASSQYGAVVGANNTISVGIRNYAFGFQNTSNSASGYSIAFGSNTNANEIYSTTFGYYSNTKLYGQFSVASGLFSQAGDAQQSLLTARKSGTLTTAATTVLSLDGTGTTNLIIPNGTNRVWNVTVKWVAVVTTITGTATGVTVGDIITQVQTLGFKKIGGTSSVVGTANTISTNADASMSTATMTYSAGASQELALTFTAPTFAGGGSITCRVVAKVELTEVAY